MSPSCFEGCVRTYSSTYGLAYTDAGKMYLTVFHCYTVHVVELLN